EEKKVSDDMEKIYDYAEKLIRQGNAYVCECDPETIKTNRFNGIECKCRGNSLEYNLRRFEEAKEGKIAPGKAVIRLKGDMKSTDFSLRDPSLLRIIDTKYKPYKLWPLYDFASVIEDEICGVTHILRSNEFRTSLQEILRKIMGFRKPTIVQFSRYNFEGTPFSKRKIRELIEKGYIKDWNDIRLPTITAIRRRGIQPQAIYEFARRARYSSAEHVYSWDFLMTMNRRVIDPTSKRLFFVESPVRLVVTGSPTMIVKLKNHPSEDLGERTLEVDGNFFVPKRDADIMKEGSFVRLKDLYTIRIDKKYDDSIYASMFSQQKRGDEKIIQWIPQRESMEVSITKVGSLMIGNEFNPDSLSTIHGLAEINVKDLKQGEIIQFERFGFCILDDKEKASFIFITD
ncbi:MAG: glutamate--tRNA ligase family protein, partial [Nanoarchaeota archaeon]|nr:glutamate--tRNA ligase family protein [Nanoarchaeota archaeon]